MRAFATSSDFTSSSTHNALCRFAQDGQELVYSIFEPLRICTWSQTILFSSCPMPLTCRAKCLIKST
eukprot:759470-Hanusia_phi.AAC.2